MRRILFLVVVALLFSSHSFAKHVKGGWILYEYQSAGATTNTSIYKITVTVYYSCTQQGPRNISVGIYDGVTNASVSTNTIDNANSENSVSKTTYSSCLSSHPDVCDLIDVYTETVTLSNNSNGYLIAVRSLIGERTDNVDNISNSGKTQLVIMARIPGIINGVDYHKNTSPTFVFKDTAIICYGGHFDYQFSAVDNVDNDSLSYSFGNAMNCASTTSPPFPSVSYPSPYKYSSPLGSKVTIDPATGLISGTAPSTTGEYIIDVYVKEWRQGVLIDSVLKELEITVNNCSLLSADLESVYVNCDSLTLSFQNESSASNITNYLWNFGDANSKSNTSTDATVTHKYSQAGEYTLTLSVSNNDGCNNSATAKVKVYPGFKPNFKTVGSCYQSPITFINTTYAKYGVVNSWEWNFGDPTSASNTVYSVFTAYTDTATHQYSTPQTATVIMKVASSVGCSGSDTMQVLVNDKPTINLLPYPDTVICDKDSVKLTAQTTATVFSWSPQTNMINSTTLTPTVYPKTNTTYTLTAKQDGCEGSASVLVNAVHYITVSFNPDTMHACKKDSIVLSPITQASSFLWTETGSVKTLSNDTVRNPKASPYKEVTTYHLTANLGSCPAQASITVYASPSPVVKIKGPYPDTTICYGVTALLRAAITGNKAMWSPSAGLSDSTSLTPTASPISNTTYTLAVNDNGYCHKYVSDSVVIKVVPAFNISAGDDTAVIIGEQLAISATLSDTAFSYPLTYKWTPSKYVNLVDSPNIIITGLANAPDSIKYRVTATTKQGCTDTSYVTVKFYSTKPDIFVPSAFTPNGDGHNDVLKPIPVGIAHFEYFRVYDRYGHLVYSTNQIGTGWDGTINGSQADNGTFIYMARGIDYLKNVINKKGAVVLFR